MSFYFFYFHHADGKHPITAEVIVEREFLPLDPSRFSLHRDPQSSDAAHSAEWSYSTIILIFFMHCNRVSYKKPPRLPVTETGAVYLHYLCFFKPSRHYLRGFLIAAGAGAKITERFESHTSTYNCFYNFASSYIVVSFQPHCYSVKTWIHCSLIYIALVKHISNVPFNRFI